MYLVFSYKEPPWENDLKIVVRDYNYSETFLYAPLPPGEEKNR